MGSADVIGIMEVVLSIFVLFIMFAGRSKKGCIAGVSMLVSGICLGIGSNPSRDAPNGIPGMVTAGWGLCACAVILIIWVIISKDIKITKTKVQNDQPSYTQEEFETFCKKEPNLWQLQQTAKKELNICARNAVAGSSVNIMPIPPQYTRGLIKGSLIDNIAVIANAQKSEDYQRALKSYEEGKKSNTQFNSIAQQHADSYFEAELKLIEMLANTPGGERYVAGEIATMEKVKTLLSKKA